MSGVCREVLTLQIGHYSNFVGTHWWNLQDASLCYGPDVPPDELQSDVLFREGLTMSGQITYTPRLIALDLKGSLQTLKQEGCLYATEKDNSAFTWQGELVTHSETPADKNMFLQDLDRLDTGELIAEPDFSNSTASARQSSSANPVAVETVNSSLERIRRSYRLEDSVRVWSDFLRLHLHPHSISVINQYNHDSDAARLEAFGQGEALLQGSELEELEDKLHFFIEECDYLQGFQVLCDLADGFSGLGSKITELLQDSYSGRGILTWGMAPVSHSDSSPIKEAYHMMNCVLGMVHMANHSSLFCPLTLRGGLGRCPAPPMSFPLLSYDPSLWYHSSSVLALALDAMTAPYRLRYNSVPMWQLADAFNYSGRKVVCAYGSVPFPMMQGSSLPDALTACADTLPWKPLSGCPERANGRCFGQSVTLRGLEGQSQVSSLAPGTEPSSILHSAQSGEDVLGTYLTTHYPSTPLAIQLLSSPSKVTPPFPQIFNPILDSQGFLQNQTSSTVASPPVLSLPVLSSLQSSSSISHFLAELQKSCSAIDLRRISPSFLSPDDQTEMAESLEQLRTLAHCYRDDSGGLVLMESSRDSAEKTVRDR
ncbi:protein misato homolog 1 isoform X1 [Silurus meridionalis]|nr:protein misato homolog 1 isoform X1 [Silurus meridionalis]XP_046714873.1 protein misato homolog 1 isoform X1 [Silurus meridionalis]XP_046714874.1 protein misato homolog 1 isoform X1 [Silurus meridionalis]